MRTSVAILGLVGAGSLSILAAGCAAEPISEKEAAAMEEDERKIAAAAEDFEYAPTEEALAEISAANERGKDEPLVGKGSDDRNRGFTWSEAVVLQLNETVTFETANGNDTIDPVLVLYMRHSPWNSATWVGYPYNEKVGITTLAQNDDTSGRNARISYTNNTGNVLNTWVMGFAWANRVGSLPVYKNGAYIGDKPFTSGSIRVYSSAGQVYTTGGGDPVLFAFDTFAGSGAGNGAWNDDDPNGGTDARITGYTDKLMWLVPMVYHSHSRTEGVSTIHY